MKILVQSFVIIFIALLMPKLSFGGAILFISENKNTSANEVIYNKYTEKELNSFYSDKQLGSVVENGKTYFRLFAPSPVKVELVVFEKVTDENGSVFQMSKDSQGVWEFAVNQDLSGKFYSFLVYHKKHIEENIKPPFSVDPYAKAVATFTDYFNPRRSIVYSEIYDWENDKWIQRDWRDLVIYEMHVRDLTSHKSSGSNQPGTYQGLVEKKQTGGINYIKDLGVNTVELLPAQEFGYIEIPYNDSLNGKFNTWNPYERNHWGYMTSNYFAPASYYAENIGKLKRDEWIGTSGDQVKHFKDMVKAFHKEGIAVMMDVVYNHLSEYEIGNLKEIDRDYYFRLDSNGNYIAQSYCGNDLKTERPMLRKLIVESILYWMKEYHIDGFRFDLGKLIDWETIEAVIHEARKINPHVVIVCEPWGGGYDPQGFSLRGWGSWNDQIRNGIKGENPYNGLGWIFGEWYGNNNRDRIKSYVRGTLIKEAHGLFQESKHSVNYLESHDGYTLGDFIRIGLEKINSETAITDIDKNVELSELELKLHKLAALFLFTSQGITMIHEGQEFARSKVIYNDVNVEDEHKEMIDHNSYNKDNETNYLNFRHAEINNELLKYYQGLIKFRNIHNAFKKADFNNYKFITIEENNLSLVFELNYKNYKYFVAFNADRNKNQKIKLPDGWWEILADENTVMPKNTKSITGDIELKASSGIVLKKK
ncbi:MAG: pullulanase [Ignavibacteriales bacterium]|nr:pullulanase [Ignavibacteriales bacterium]